jgi:hypothetical protein
MSSTLNYPSKRRARTRQKCLAHNRSHLPALAASETPGPHRLQQKPERSEDIAYYKAKLVEQQHTEEAMGQNDSPASNEALLSVFQSLTKVLKDNNQHLQSSDVTEPTKFNGLDTQWDDFYLQLRTYLEEIGRLDTVDHKTGPGSPGFNTEINEKIYNKLLALCRKGTAGTYVTKAASSNGWEAGRYLIERYEGFSKQLAHSLQNLIENIRHIHGTNMTRHIDKFERICGMMAHSNPDKPPTDEDKVEWFLESVTEKTYDSVHAGCTEKQLDGTLTFARVVKLYTHHFLSLPRPFPLSELGVLKEVALFQKEETQEKEEVAVIIDPDLSRAIEIKIPTPIMTQTEKERRGPKTKRQTGIPPSYLWRSQAARSMQLLRR